MFDQRLMYKGGVPKRLDQQGCAKSVERSVRRWVHPTAAKLATCGEGLLVVRTSLPTPMQPRPAVLSSKLKLDRPHQDFTRAKEQVGRRSELLSLSVTSMRGCQTKCGLNCVVQERAPWRQQRKVTNYMRRSPTPTASVSRGRNCHP